MRYQPALTGVMKTLKVVYGLGLESMAGARAVSILVNKKMKLAQLHQLISSVTLATFALDKYRRFRAKTIKLLHCYPKSDPKRAVIFI